MTDPEGDPISYVWEFGDGDTALEHAWDEGFGYFGAAINYGAYTDQELRVMLGSEIVDRYRIVQHDCTNREAMVNRNYELGTRFFSYSVLRRGLRVLLTNYTGLDDL